MNPPDSGLSLGATTPAPETGAPGHVRPPDRQPPDSRPPDSRPPDSRPGLGLSFRALLTLLLLAATVLPLAAFGVLLLITGLATESGAFVPLLIATIVVSALVGLVAAASAATTLTVPLSRITRAVERVAAGEPSPPIHLTGEDELARLAESHNRIAADVGRRNRELDDLLVAVGSYSPADGVAALAKVGERDACHIYSLIDCRIRLVDPAGIPREMPIPGDPLPVRATVRAGSDTLGLLTGHLPATRSWEPADQALLDLFASEVGVALRNAELFGQIDSQNARLLELDTAKDEFLRGVSHNLQTPLTSIRAYVDQLRSETDDAAHDRRLQIVAEQSDRLTRLVRQLLTVTRLEAGALRSQPEVIAPGNRIRRAWEGLNAAGVDFELHDEARGWLAVADPDQLDQVLWALLDNAVKYGEGVKIVATVHVDDAAGHVAVTIADLGRGISDEDRGRLFNRFSRGSAQGGGEGTGLGLYVSRELMRGMGGDLWLEPQRTGVGAEFTLSLPGEPPDDGA